MTSCFFWGKDNIRIPALVPIEDDLEMWMDLWALWISMVGKY